MPTISYTFVDRGRLSSGTVKRLSSFPLGFGAATVMMPVSPLVFGFGVSDMREL